MSAVEKEQPEAANTRFAKDQLKAFVERIERLEEEKKAMEEFGSSDSGASLGDILGAALKARQDTGEKIDE